MLIYFESEWNTDLIEKNEITQVNFKKLAK